MTKTAKELLAELTSYTGSFPEEAVRVATERVSELTPKLLMSLEESISEPERIIEQNSMLHTYAMYLLGHARETKAFPLLLRMARLPSKQLDGLLGDTITEGLPQALASTCSGDWESLKVLVEDVEADEFSRKSGLVAMLCLVAEGDLEASKVMNYCHHLLTGGLEREYSYIWDGLIHTILELGVGPCEEAIRKAYADGLVDPMNISLKDVERALAQPNTPELRDSKHDHYQYLNDCETEMSWWASFNPEPAVPKRNKTRKINPKPTRTSTVSPPRTSRKIGRNEPCPCGSEKKYKKCCGG
jgi:hypothetical protein